MTFADAFTVARKYAPLYGTTYWVYKIKGGYYPIGSDPDIFGAPSGAEYVGRMKFGGPIINKISFEEYK